MVVSINAGSYCYSGTMWGEETDEWMTPEEKLSFDECNFANFPREICHVNQNFFTSYR